MQIHFDNHHHWENPICAHRPLIHFDRCQRCGTCAEFCQRHAIMMMDHGAFEVHPDYCIGCGMCVNVCPNHAIELVEIGGVAVLA